MSIYLDTMREVGTGGDGGAFFSNNENEGETTTEAPVDETFGMFKDTVLLHII